MTKLLKNLLISVIIFTLVLTLLPTHQTLAATTKKYLILVAQYDGRWNL